MQGISFYCILNQAWRPCAVFSSDPAHHRVVSHWISIRLWTTPRSTQIRSILHQLHLHEAAWQVVWQTCLERQWPQTTTQRFSQINRFKPTPTWLMAFPWLIAGSHPKSICKSLTGTNLTCIYSPIASNVYRIKQVKKHIYIYVCLFGDMC